MSDLIFEEMAVAILKIQNNKCAVYLENSVRDLRHSQVTLIEYARNIKPCAKELKNEEKEC